jgi:very-short-patch-repair endonuclease
MRAPAKTISRAKGLRRRLTPPEARLWVALSRERLNGLHFRKQHPFGPYVLDFYCSAARLAVEVDGGWHDTEQAIRRDARRDAWLTAKGIRTVRVSAEAVRVNLESVLDYIAEVAREGPLSQTVPV